jgi:hypothetical protein
VGAGGSLEAAYPLSSPIKAGTWQIVGDGIIIDSCDVTFAVLWRTTAGDTPVATFTHHFDPAASISDAVLYDGTAAGIAVTPAAGDQLVLHITAANPAAGTGSLYGLNGDGAADGGRKPFLTLPQ